MSARMVNYQVSINLCNFILFHLIANIFFKLLLETFQFGNTVFVKCYITYADICHLCQSAVFYICTNSNIIAKARDINKFLFTCQQERPWPKVQ